jgi:ribonucleoside-triphosphate reductase
LSILHRRRGIKVLKAVSSSVRLKILNLLFDRGSLSYTELMNSLKMNPARDAGRFAYHLKFLLKTDLIEADTESKKYYLTDLGKLVIDVADKIENKAFTRRKKLVRTSRFALEEFDTNKIARSLIKEANMPAELAQKVAKEAEKRLLKSKTKYLTAPLVREIVNAVLIEKGLEDYRHKLTRLGLPVYDVQSLIETKSKNLQGATSVQETAGKIILSEYTLLNIFPRDIADAYLSGALHIKDLGSWILKPEEIVHDLRFFLQKGFKLEKPNSFEILCHQPKNFKSALSLLLNVLLHSTKEICESQTLEYFNIFLAPLIKNRNPQEIKDALSHFLFTLRQHLDVSLCLELSIPPFISEKPVQNSSGKIVGNYKDFVDQSQLLASILLEIFTKESDRKPLTNPKLLLKLRQENINDERAKELLLKAHQLASKGESIYFANLCRENRKFSVFSTSGFKLNADLSGDWEIDTLRAGCLGSVSINLPRVMKEAERDEGKFLEILKERVEMAIRALEIKYRSVKRHISLLPFLLQRDNGDHYLRLENCSRLINLVGLKETIEVFHEGNFYESEKTLDSAQKILGNVLNITRKIGKRKARRLLVATLPDFEASERLARLDIEKYGIAKVRFSGSREKPFYSTINRLTLQDDTIALNILNLTRQINKFLKGGNLTVIELGDTEYDPETLFSVTKRIMKNSEVDLFTYNRKLTYCYSCKKSWFSFLHKCPLCGSTSNIKPLNRFALA